MVGTMTYVLPRRRDACYALGSWAEDRRGQERSLARSMVESWGILKIWLLNIPELGTDGSYLSNDLMCYSLAVGHAPPTAGLWSFIYEVCYVTLKGVVGCCAGVGCEGKLGRVDVYMELGGDKGRTGQR